MRHLQVEVNRTGFIRLLTFNAFFLSLLVGCAQQPVLKRNDICLVDEEGPAGDRAVLICVLFEDRNGHLCPADALYRGISTQNPNNRPSIKPGTGPQKLSWQAVTWDSSAREHKVLDVLFKVAFDPFTGSPIKVPTGAGAQDGLARMNQGLGDCSKYVGPCIADPGRGTPADPDYREPEPVEYKYSVQKWLRASPRPEIDVNCPPLDPVFRVNF